jgi:glycyl-tRNA synthetase beta chain
MNQDFLLELRSEEIPARMQLKAKDDLVRLFTDALTKTGLAADSIEAFATPRRLALIAKGLPLETAASSEETKGPKVGAPPQAMEGFLRKVGLTQDQLVERDGVYFAIAEKPGRKTADVLAEAIPAIIRAFPWPKSQRWGAASVSTESLRWVRPLQGIIALLGDDVVDCEIDGIVSGRTTMGHRFMWQSKNTVSPEPVEGRLGQLSGASTSSAPTVVVSNAGSYVADLRAAHVIVHFSERTKIIRDGAEAAAKAAGLMLVPDEGLVTENAGLTEWPVPMLGRFDPAFLEVPQEVIQLTARVNQKYFVCNDADGKLANAFVCTANINAHDGGAAIVAGNEKVLAARLSDAKFFWELDQRKTLSEHAVKLERITFHEKIGSVADRANRTAGLAYFAMRKGWLPPLVDLIKGERDLEKIVLQAKADLVTEMVGEFPELQGIMGSYYASIEGLPDMISAAIRDQYKPAGQSDDVPSESLSVVIALCDKLQALTGFFAVGIKPTGSKDPYALRRQALGAIRIIVENGLRIPLRELLLSEMLAIFFARVRVHAEREDIEANEAIKHVQEFLSDPKAVKQTLKDKRFEEMVQEILPEFKKTHDAGIELLNFFADRLKVQQREAGVRHDLIDAVFALGGEDDLVRLLARVKALQGFVATQEGADLLAGYKRAANILKGDTSNKNTRHPELVSGSISPNEPKGETDKWMLKQVQHDDVSEVEVALLTALNTAEPLAASAIEAEQFEDAMAALASLRAPIDAFFDGVMVNDPDPEKRAFRIGLLTRFRDAVHRVADFSRIEG